MHSAIEKLSQGAKVEELTEEEQEAHRAYRRRLYAKNPEHHRRRHRERYRKRQAEMSEEEREEQRAKWRAAYRRRRRRDEEE